MKTHTLVKVLTFFTILVVVVLGSIFAPRMLIAAQGMLPSTRANNVVDEDLESNTYLNEVTEPTTEADAEEDLNPYNLLEDEEEVDEEEVELPTLVPMARGLYNNNDIVAHISIPGTAIDYLITHTDNNSFYLYHDLWLNRTAAGTVFLDYLNSTDFKDPNSIIYGHNMRNGTKFHDVRMYRSREFFEQNYTMIVTTVYDVLYYDIFAIFTTHINFNYIQVEFEDGEFLKMVEEMKERSYHDTDIEIGEEDSILTLSTCWGPVGTDYRLVLVGRLRNEEQEY